MRKHFTFTPNGTDYDVGINGQYTISLEGTSDVWVLVERHYLGKLEAWNGYLGLAVFSGNERVYSYTRPTYRVRPITFELILDGICRCQFLSVEDYRITCKTTIHHPHNRQR